MKTGSAIKKYLDISRRPQTAKQIADALEAGGFIHESKNFFNMIYTALGREERKGTVVQVPDRAWGLAERYPRNARQKAERAPRSPDDDEPSNGLAPDNEKPSDSIKQLPNAGLAATSVIASPSVAVGVNLVS